jgi:hypothetical protein
LWFFTTLIPALYIPGIGPVINIAGNAAGLMMFFYPGALMMKMAYVAHPDTITQAIKDLPYAPNEHSPDTWVYGLREERVRYIKKWQQKLMYGTGIAFVVIGLLTLLGGLSLFVYDDILNAAEAGASKHICIPPINTTMTTTTTVIPA